MMIKVIIADDHKIFRQGITRLIKDCEGIEVVGEAENGRQVVELAREISPDVVLMDISMQEMNGIDATRKILSDNPSVKVIALTIHSDRSFIAEMLKAGAVGYLLKDCAFEELESAIRVVAVGMSYLSPSIAKVIVRDYINISSGESEAAPNDITHREREVLQLIAEGHSTKQIAFELGVSIKTIETHRRNIMKKLDATSIAELVKAGIRMGLTTLE
ncbi:MAG TPA: response regulator transcription factor [candidate division Zixibacteria bacterium]|nr:response regulator transcription factor [candidate division Zixibacteria bacterium]